MTLSCLNGSSSALKLPNGARLLVAEKPAKFPLAALRWHGRFELEATTLTLPESQFVLDALVAMGDGDAEAVDVLRRLLRKVRPTMLPRVS